MHLTRLHYGTIALFAFSLLVVLASCSRKPQTPSGNGHDNFACDNQTVAVDPVKGTIPKAVYLCAGLTLTWIPNGHSFTAAFQPQTYPFQGNPQNFTNDPSKPNDPVVSPPAIYSGVLTVYSYAMTVDGKPVTDPQVVGGGSHSPN